MLKPSLQLRTGQQLTMTPQLQQAIRLLQLPVLDLQAEIHTALEENVMLELEEPDVIGDEALEHGEVSDEQRLTDDELEVEYAEISTLGQPDRPAAPQDLRDNRDYPDRSDNNLRDHLLWQLEMNRFSEDENAAGRVIIDAIDDPSRYTEVVFCGYGESTLRLKTLIQVAVNIKQRGGRVRVNTDGLANLVHKRNVLPELAACVDALSISMNAQDAATYERHCRPALPGSFDAMLAFLREAPKYIADVSASAIDGLEGVDIDRCRDMAEASGARFRRRELDLVG